MIKYLESHETQSSKPISLILVAPTILIMENALKAIKSFFFVRREKNIENMIPTIKKYNLQMEFIRVCSPLQLLSADFD